MHWITPQNTTSRSNVQIVFTLHSISVYDQPYSSYRSRRDRSNEWPQIKREHWSKVPHKCSTSTSSVKFQSTSLHDLQLSSHVSFWDKCIKWHKWHWILKLQGYPIFLLIVGRVPSFSLFGSMPSHFACHFDTRAPKLTHNELYKVKGTLYMF